MNLYINELVQFINKHSIIKSPIHHKEIELLPNGNSNVRLSFHCKMSEVNTKLPFPIKQSMMFMLLDAYVDNINPEISNGDYKTKYKSLPESDKNAKILKEIYRIFRFIRNNIIHDMSSIKNENKKIIIHGLKHSILEMKEDMINTMNYIVYIIVLNNIENTYNSLILQNLYEHFCSGIIKFTDEITNKECIESIAADVKFKHFNRAVLIGAKSRAIENDSALEVELYKDKNPYESEDYLIKIGGDFYFIPNEILEKNDGSTIGKLSTPEADKFKLNIDNPTLDILVWNLLQKHTQ